SRIRPLLERRHECFLRQVLGEADVPHDPCQPGDEPRGLNTPECVDRPLDVGFEQDLLVLLCLLADAPLLLAQLGGELLAEVLFLEHRPDLDHALLEWRALQPLDCLVHRLDLPEPVTGDELLRLGERAVDDTSVARAVELDALPARGWGDALAGEHDACLHKLLVVLSHRRQDLARAHFPRLRLRARLDEHHDSHCCSLGRFAYYLHVERATTKSTRSPSGLPSLSPRAARGDSRRFVRLLRVDRWPWCVLETRGPGALVGGGHPLQRRGLARP